MTSRTNGPVFARTKPIILLTGIVMVILGVVVLVNPIGAAEALTRIVGWVSVVYGVITLVNAIRRGNPLKEAPGELGLGILATVLGLVMAFYTGGVVTFVYVFMGVMILATGLLDIIETKRFRDDRSPIALPATVSGVITVLLGIIVIIAPMFSVALSMLFAAVALIVDGITEIIFGLGM